jgi:hypothetical protein
MGKDGMAWCRLGCPCCPSTTTTWTLGALLLWTTPTVEPFEHSLVRSRAANLVTLPGRCDSFTVLYYALPCHALYTADIQHALYTSKDAVPHCLFSASAYLL